MSNPLVSICCITYNHAPFIRKCLDGFLMQQPPTCIAHNRPQSSTIAYNSLSSWLEILIHDDASTDGTTEIIKEYESKYPDIIKPIYEIEGVYHKAGKHHIDWYNFHRAQGKYIAYCEGDDYWTDSLKLQKQVDFMEVHPDYSVCFHNFMRYNANTGEFSNVKYRSDIKLENGGLDITPYLFFHGTYGGQPLTMLFRSSCYSLDWENLYHGFRDTHQIYHLLRQGKGYYMDFMGGVYVHHNGGISSAKSTITACREEREHILELYLQNKDDSMLADYLDEILLWNYSVYANAHQNKEFWRIFTKFMYYVPKIAVCVCTKIVKRKVINNLHV